MQRDSLSVVTPPRSELTCAEPREQIRTRDFPRSEWLGPPKVPIYAQVHNFQALCITFFIISRHPQRNCCGIVVSSLRDTKKSQSPYFIHSGFHLFCTALAEHRLVSLVLTERNTLFAPSFTTLRNGRIGYIYT